MRFRLRTAGRFYSDEEERKRLSKLGFQFVPLGQYTFLIEGTGTVEINTLEELLAFLKEFGSIIVEDYDSLIIYDHYIE